MMSMLILRRTLMVVTLTFACLAQTAAEEPQSAIARYGNLKPPQIKNMFDGMDDGWQDRVALEFEIMNNADLESLRAALEDERPVVRSMAARALGILADRESADALANLVKSDPSFLVRIRAVESLGFLKLKPEVIELATKDVQGGVRWSAKLAAEQCNSEDDYAAQVRRAFAVGIERNEMGQAKVGQPAPDIDVQTLDGKPFKLSSVLGKRPIAIYFAAFDG
jgi:HEAT repeat protein